MTAVASKLGGAAAAASPRWAMGQDDTDLLASVEDVRKMTDPQDSLQALVAGIAGLQEQIQEWRLTPIPPFRSA